MQDNSAPSEYNTSSYNTHSHTSGHGARPVGPDHPRVRFFALALLLILSIAGGFLGGYLAKGADSAMTIEKQQVVLKTQGQVISTIAQNVGESVVSVNTTAP